MTIIKLFPVGVIGILMAPFSFSQQARTNADSLYDGGGSSCMLVNGRETIKPGDKEGERPVPAVFIIREMR